MIAMGPTIHSCCYEVGPEFQNAFGSFVIKRPKALRMDLPGWIKQELVLAGVQAGSIYNSGICTACHNNRFPSYRKEGPDVRPILSVMMLI